MLDKAIKTLLLFAVTIFGVACVVAQSSSDRRNTDGNLQTIVDNAVKETLARFGGDALEPDQFAVSVINLNSDNPSPASYRGESQIYAASVVKLFYLAYYHRLLEDGRLQPTAEIERGVRDMIVDSGNEATGYVLDVLTATSSGAELSAKQFENWKLRRNAVNRYFSSLGYKNINVNQKTHCEDAYGVEQQFREYKNENRNMLTTNASVKLMAEIAEGRSVTQARSNEMLRLLRRDWEKPVKDAFYQEFISWALIPGSKIWTKEGFTSKTRHDVAYIETPDGLRLVIAVFTENHSSNKEIIPNVAREIIRGLGGKVR